MAEKDLASKKIEDYIEDLQIFIIPCCSSHLS